MLRPSKDFSSGLPCSGAGFLDAPDAANDCAGVDVGWVHPVEVPEWPTCISTSYLRV